MLEYDKGGQFGSALADIEVSLGIYRLEQRNMEEEEEEADDD